MPLARRAAATTITLVVVAACAGRHEPSPPAIRLVPPQNSAPARVEVSGVSEKTIGSSPEDWAKALRVSVDPAAPPMLGTYGLADGSVFFIPAYPLDPGRPYHVRFELPGSGSPLTATVGLPAQHTTPSTAVARVYPSGDVVPENLLRMYIEFSAPMGRPSGVPYMKLLDETGTEIPAAFLPLDYEFWSPDHTRFTAFLDPGRVKRGILPNQQMGRALKPGHAVTLAISREWRDANGLPLKEDFTRVFRVGPADTKPLDPKTWRIEPPSAGQRDGLVVRFNEPLDRGLLMRAMGVRCDGAAVDGEIAVGAGETVWTFTPRQPWRAGAYQLLALEILEDVAGNQVGRAFEVDNFDTVDKSPNPETIAIPFTVRTASDVGTRK